MSIQQPDPLAASLAARASLTEERIFPPVPAPAAAISPSRVWLDDAPVLVDDPTAVSFTSISLADYVPAGTTEVTLDCHAEIDDNSEGEINVRRDAEGASLVFVRGGIAAEAVKRRRGNQIDCPVGRGLTIEYEIADAFLSVEIRLVAYTRGA